MIKKFNQRSINKNGLEAFSSTNFSSNMSFSVIFPFLSVWLCSFTLFLFYFIFCFAFVVAKFFIVFNWTEALYFDR